MIDEERAAWIALVNATTLRADAQCEPDPLDAFEAACAARIEALATLKRLGVDTSVLVDPHGLWPKSRTT